MQESDGLPEDGAFTSLEEVGGLRLAGLHTTGIGSHVGLHATGGGPSNGEYFPSAEEEVCGPSTLNPEP